MIKYFKTQLLALGVQPDYADYMMGHTVDTYHDIQMKGVEFLRNVYASSGLTIRPKTRVGKIDALVVPKAEVKKREAEGYKLIREIDGKFMMQS